MRQLRQPRLADIVAGRLREDILSGRLTEGHLLPRQERLLEQYGVSPPVLREALRILETDGLISVRRGNVGGAVVHLPTLDRTAQMISMVLQTRKTTAADVSQSLTRLEPICAGMCALRADRDDAVVPVLRDIIERQTAEIDDLEAYIPNARHFHESLVSLCGNDSMIVVVGSLEVIWSAHESSVWSGGTDAEDHGAGSGQVPAPPMARSVRRAAIRAHERLVDAIEAGTETRAQALAASHLASARRTTLASDPGSLIRAAAIPDSAQ